MGLYDYGERAIEVKVVHLTADAVLLDIRYVNSFGIFASLVCNKDTLLHIWCDNIPHG